MSAKKRDTPETPETTTGFAKPMDAPISAQDNTETAPSTLIAPETIAAYQTLFDQLGRAYWEASEVKAKDTIQGARDAVYEILTELNRAKLEANTEALAALEPKIKASNKALAKIKDKINNITKNISTASSVIAAIAKVISIAT
jgi:hypothetical protein